MLTRRNRELVRDLLDLADGHVVSMTVAPELARVEEALQELVDGGALPSFGHTEASAVVTCEALGKEREEARHEPA